MSNREPRSGHEATFERLKVLTQNLPAHLEIHRLLLNLGDPANDEMSKDRYTALIAGGSVDESLKLAIEKTSVAPKNFFDRIEKAKNIGLVRDGQAIELHKIRLIRNVFAHALAPIGFDDPSISEATKGLWDHPVSSWSGYFAPVFAPRHQYAIVCGEFCKQLLLPPQ
ncbi:hypothetical protein [uncultured Caulobacter sp.]|jgi:hypothetical protein|uniref:DUF4145 domain-containing protein n=1 Tax=uncultured Caulobacter sp. TaxID=158749 RepID=UPI002631FE0E|nr:hypothetical protein [uncultured Caulobacter sp.]